MCVCVCVYINKILYICVYIERESSVKRCFYLDFDNY